jgi:hypothetical protein
MLSKRERVRKGEAEKKYAHFMSLRAKWYVYDDVEVVVVGGVRFAPHSIRFFFLDE